MVWTTWRYWASVAVVSASALRYFSKRAPKRRLLLTFQCLPSQVMTSLPGSKAGASLPRKLLSVRAGALDVADAAGAGAIGAGAAWPGGADEPKGESGTCAAAEAASSHGRAARRRHGKIGRFIGEEERRDCQSWTPGAARPFKSHVPSGGSTREPELVRRHCKPRAGPDVGIPSDLAVWAQIASTMYRNDRVP